MGGRLFAAASVVACAVFTGCVAHKGRAIVPEPHPERYVPILEGLSVEQVRKALDVLVGLKPELAGGLSIQLVVPRSVAGEAFRRLLNDPMREFPVLVQWD